MKMAETDGKAFQSDVTPYFVSVEIPTGDGNREITKVNVRPGNDVDDVRKKIKKQCSPDFDSIP